VPTPSDAPTPKDTLTVKDLDCYISILKLAEKWEMAEAKTHAKKAIESSFWMSSHHARLIGLTFKYHIPSWFNESFRTLVRRQLTNYSLAEMEEIGLQIMMALTKTQDAISQHKMLLAHSPPPIQHTNVCIKHV
jgi:hypothetical protein